MHRWLHIASWSCLFPVSGPEFLSCVHIRNGLPVTFLAFYYNNKAIHLVRCLRSSIGRIPHTPRTRCLPGFNSYTPESYSNTPGSATTFLFGLARICLFGRIPIHAMDTSPHTQDSPPLPRIHFLYPGFISLTQDSFLEPRIHFRIPHTCGPIPSYMRSRFRSESLANSAAFPYAPCQIHLLIPRIHILIPRTCIPIPWDLRCRFRSDSLDTNIPHCPAPY
ncbi:hypothetical protein BD311DRAFT_747617 [Dichomitus squalens]|uniref:Uncharacterized protein n=1 Tax=Dichomitus squalens TaxID=114155 RepID=A0A4Q9N664_9APHY|nr:hypothetical protein BD311DRAFT_747617 [Dichomitus squalens]